MFGALIPDIEPFEGYKKLSETIQSWVNRYPE